MFYLVFTSVHSFRKPLISNANIGIHYKLLRGAPIVLLFNSVLLAPRDCSTDLGHSAFHRHQDLGIGHFVQSNDPPSAAAQKNRNVRLSAHASSITYHVTMSKNQTDNSAYQLMPIIGSTLHNQLPQGYAVEEEKCMSMREICFPCNSLSTIN